ncbi:MAG TPA: sulfurtransferase TusA [Succinivibrionaceae bacterium]|nr:sulfurtransferase TusA [Succinivibrionaceae bacterium]
METLKIDATGLSCPEPLTLLRNAIRKADNGQVIEILSDDPVSLRDIPAFCNFMKHELLSMPTEESPNLFIIKKTASR